MAPRFWSGHKRNLGSILFSDVKIKSLLNRNSLGLVSRFERGKAGNDSCLSSFLDVTRSECCDNILFMKVWQREAGIQVVFGKLCLSSREENGEQSPGHRERGSQICG